MRPQSLAIALKLARRYAFARQGDRPIIVAFTPVGDNETATALLARARLEAKRQGCDPTTVFIHDHDLAWRRWSQVVRTAIDDVTKALHTD